MPGNWDTNLKLLLNANPEHFVQWLFPEATFQGKVEKKSNNLETRQLEVDGLLQFVLYGVACLLHIEFQSYYDENMAKRMWEYNASATILYGKPTYSFLIYLKECQTTEPSYEVKYPTGESNHHFDFRVIKLWEYHPDDIKALGLSGLLPLMVLTKGGNAPTIFEEVVSDLQTVEEDNRKELVSALFVLSALVMTEEAQKRWLKRKFTDMNKELEESWIYQLILKEGHEKGIREGLREGIHEGLQSGLQQGMQQGMQQGREEERREESKRLRQILTSYVELRFPSIARDARKHVETIQDPDVLQQVTLKIYTAQTEEQTMEILREAA